MKLLFTLCLLVVIILSLLIFVKTFDRDVLQKSITKKLRILVFFCILCCLANIGIAHSQNCKSAEIAYSLYYASINWISFFLSYFIIDFCFPNRVHTNTKLNRNSIQNVLANFTKKGSTNSIAIKGFFNIFAVIFAIDTVVVLTNSFTHKVFNVIYQYCYSYFFDNDWFFLSSKQGYFDIHLTINYFLIALSFVSLVIKVVESQPHYKIKYIIPFSIISLVIILNYVYLILNMPLDFSVAFYGFAIIALYYTALKYIPNYLVHKTTSVVMDFLNNGIIIMDDNDTCIYINNFVKKLYHIEAPDDPVITNIIEKYSGGIALSEKAPFEDDIQELQGNKTSYYRYSFKFIGDQKNNYLGSFFLIYDTTEENERNNKEIFENLHDKLTGLYNKEYFYRKSEDILEKNSNEKYLMICSDISDFKLINDLYGLSLGDKILRQFAEFLENHLSQACVYCRYEAAKFAVLMPASEYDKTLFQLLQKEIFSSPNLQTLSARCNIGVYEIDDPDISIMVMCDRAFSAIETLSGNFDDFIAWYDSKLRSSILREQELISQLPDAIDSHQILMYLQPRADFSKKILGSEALVRWIHPENGMISPGEFIPIFEKQGSITQLDKFIWKKACQKLAEWQETGHEDLYISINISPKDFYLMDVEKELTNLVQEYNVQPKNLKLEITEDAIMIDMDRQIQIFENLRAKGFVIELDNFGSGYSSLNILKDVPVDVLKLDIRFLKVPKNPERAKTIIKQMVQMAKGLGISVLAEGIETLDELEFMKETGCDTFQGYLLEAPIEVEKFERLYMQ